MKLPEGMYYKISSFLYGFPLIFPFFYSFPIITRGSSLPWLSNKSHGIWVGGNSRDDMGDPQLMDPFSGSALIEPRGAV